MILDPSVNNCVIWHNQMFTTIKGNPDEVCREIYKRVTTVEIDEVDGVGNFTTVKQLCEIGIDIGGIGVTYKHILHQMGIRSYDIKGGSNEVVLPIRNEQMLGITDTFYEQNASFKLLYRTYHPIS